MLSEIRDSARSLRPASIGTGLGRSRYISDVDIWRLVLAYVGFYVVASVVSCMLIVGVFPLLLGGLVFIPIGVPLSK